MNIRSRDKQVFTQPRVLTADVACAKDEFVKIGSITCPAGQIWGIGYANNLGQQDSLGRAFFKPIDTVAAAMVGSLRVFRVDANDLPQDLVFEGHTSELTATVADRSTWRVLEDKNKQIKEDSKYDFYFQNDNAVVTLDVSASTMFIDGMRYMI